MKTYEHFIDGAWKSPDAAAWLDSIDPATGKIWARIPRGNGTDANAAMASAQAAFETGPWASATTDERTEWIVRFADTLEERWEELVEAEIRDNGKRITEVRGQFAGLHTWFRHFAEQALQIAPHGLENDVPGVENHAEYAPYGVVVAITPWNSPLMIAAWKAAPALAAGNTMVIKPSEHASASTLEFARLAAQSGLPAGVLNVVTGYGHEVGEPLVRHPHAKKVTFTGSDAGGSRVAAAAADGVIPVTLELGGKSPQLVFADADIDNAVNGILSGIFLSNGQTCVAGSRVIVQATVHDELVDRLVARARTLAIGDPLDPATQVVPLANAPHLEKVLSMIAEAKADGAKCLCGGERMSPAARPDGFYVAPTIFSEVTPGMRLWREEVFGPVLAIAPFETEEQGLSLANDSDYGLAAGIWTSDAERARRLAGRIAAGTVYINHYRSVSPGSPIGGFKRSGYGRELGPDAVKEFLQTRSVWVGTAPCADPFPEPAG